MSIRNLSDAVSDSKSSVTGLVQEYKDLSLAFKLHPEFGDVRPVKDLNAIKNSVKNILLTKKGERPFNPLLGCNLKKYLFEPADGFTKNAIEHEIRTSIGEQEPRVKIIDLIVAYNADKNSYEITITVSIVGSSRELDIELYLERLR